MKVDLYSELEIDRDAPLDVIKRAYRKAAAKHHPDKGGDRDKFALVILARNILTDPGRRARYNKTGDAEDLGPDQTETDAMQIAFQAIGVVIAQIEQRGRDASQYNVLADAVRGLKTKIAEMKAAEQGAKDSAAKLRKLAKRFKAKRGKPNRIVPMMEAQARSQEEMSGQAVQSLPAYERAIVLLDEHTFDADPAAPYAPAPNAFFR